MNDKIKSIQEDIRRLRDSNDHVCQADLDDEKACSCSGYDQVIDNLELLKTIKSEEYATNPDGEWEVEYEENYVDGFTEDRVRRFYGNDKLKLNQDNTVNITSVEEKMYSREEVIKSLQTYADFTSGGECRQDEVNNWIKENL